MRILVISTVLVTVVLAAANLGSASTSAATPTSTPPTTVSSTPSPTSTPAPSPVDPAAVQQQQIDATNRGDVAGVMAFFTDDAVFSGGGFCMAPCVGKAAIQGEIEHEVANHSMLTRTSFKVNGTTVTGRVEVRGDNFTRAGVQRIALNFTVETRGTKISAIRLAIDLSDPQTAQFVRSLVTSPAVTAPATGTGPDLATSAAWPRTLAITIICLGCLMLAGGVILLASTRRTPLV